MSSRELPILWQRYVDGGLDVKDAKTLIDLLEKHPGERERFLDDLEMVGLIRQIAVGGDEFVRTFRKRLRAAEESGNPPGAVAAMRRREKPGVKWGPWLSMAACLAIIVGALVYNQWRSTQFGEVLVAHIKATAPDVRIIRRGKTIIAVVDMDILTGDRIETGPGRSATFTYENEKTEILIDENTMLDVGGVEDGKRLRLEKGVLDATVDPQPAGRPMIVTTPHAEAEVKGTRFKLTVDRVSTIVPLPAGERSPAHTPLPSGERLGEGEKPDHGTRIDVFEGLVRFTRLSDEDRIDVGAGQYAVAGAGIDLEALPIQGVAGIPAADERVVLPDQPEQVAEVRYVDGPVIFEDDFEKDLSKWKVIRRDPGAPGKCAPASAAERGRVGIRGPVEGGPQTRFVAIDVRGMAGVGIGIQPRIAAMPQGYVVEWDMRLQTRDAFAIITYPDVTKCRRLHEFVFKSEYRWYRRRVELVSGQGAEGQTVYDVKSYIAGRLVVRDLLEFPNEPLILTANAGMIIIDNVVIRTLIPEGNAGKER